MRAIVPVLIVILGLGAREHANRQLLGGLEHADRTAITQLVREHVSELLNEISPRLTKTLRDVSGGTAHDRRPAHRRSGHNSHSLNQPSSQVVIRVHPGVIRREVSLYHREQTTRRRPIGRSSGRLRGFGQTDAGFEPGGSVEVTFVLPVEEKVSAYTTQGTRSGSGRRR